MRSPPADTLVESGAQRVARAATTGDFLGVRPASDVVSLEPFLPNAVAYRGMVFMEVPEGELPLWRDLMDALSDWPGRSESRKPLSDRMNVGE